MPLSPLELAGLASGAALVVIAAVGAVSVVDRRRRERRDHEALGDALAASEAVSAALSEEALFLSAILSAVDAVIVLFDRAGRVRYANDRFEEVFGVRSSEVVGRSRVHFVEAIAPSFAEPDAFRAAASAAAKEDRGSGPRSTRLSGIVAPDESELVLERPAPRVLLFSQQPVAQGDARIGVLGMFRDVTAQRAAEDARRRLLAELEARATTDALTGLANRRAAGEALAAEMERARRYERPVAVALFDLDHFKRVNDELGHEAGDTVLRAFADVLRRTARSTDVVARWGGEEFLAILPEADLDAALTFAERVRAGLAELGGLAAVVAGAAARPLTCSGGVTALREDDGADALVRRADVALYAAKRDGRDRVRATR